MIRNFGTLDIYSTIYLLKRCVYLESTADVRMEISRLTLLKRKACRPKPLPHK